MATIHVFAEDDVPAVADALAFWLRPNRFLREQTELAEDALDPATMLAHLPEVLRGSTLQPVYDARSPGCSAGTSTLYRRAE